MQLAAHTSNLCFINSCNSDKLRAAKASICKPCTFKIRTYTPSSKLPAWLVSYPDLYSPQHVRIACRVQYPHRRVNTNRLMYGFLQHYEISPHLSLRPPDREVLCPRAVSMTTSGIYPVTPKELYIKCICHIP